MAANEQGGAGGGQDAAEQRVAAGGGDPRGERGLEHLARLARVADDQNLRGGAGRDARDGSAERQREVGGQEAARDAAYAVGAEERADETATSLSASRTAGAYGPS